MVGALDLVQMRKSKEMRGMWWIVELGIQNDHLRIVGGLGYEHGLSWYYGLKRGLQALLWASCPLAPGLNKIFCESHRLVIL